MVVQNLVDFLIDSGVSVINSITPGVPKAIAFYKVLPVEVEIMGTSVEIIRFLKYLENPSSYFILESIALTQGGNLFKANLKINAVMLKTPEKKKGKKKKR